VPRHANAYSSWRDGGPENALTAMWHAFVDDGGVMLPMTRAVDLEVDGGAVVGVHVEMPDGRKRLIRGRKVVMADGGFQANRELVGQHVTRHSYRPLGSEFDVGDCLLMGMRHGAKAVDLDSIYVTVVPRDSVDREIFRRVQPPVELMAASVVVNARGERVGDEAIGPEEYSVIDVRIATWMAKTDAPDCWVVFDDEAWRTVASSDAMGKLNKHTGLTLNPAIDEYGGTHVTAQTIEELAGKIGIPAANLSATVDGFNAFVRDGAPIEPERTNSPPPLVEAPLHAFPLGLGIYFTMGGLLVNAHGQVLDEDERPIPNLYAAGGTMGGLQSGPENGYSGGWAEATTFGLLAAEHAAGELGKQVGA
jgi:fumarate reductase flavoprotein subunit